MNIIKGINSLDLYLIPYLEYHTTIVDHWKVVQLRMFTKELDRQIVY